MTSLSLFGSELYVVASTSREVTIYDLEGNRLTRYEPTMGRITRTQYQNGRASRDTIEYHSLPALPWFFSASGSFFAFMPSGDLRYYSDINTYIDYAVTFSPSSILQIIDDNRILIRNANNSLAIWYRSLGQERNLSINLTDIARALYLPHSIKGDMLLLAREQRLDYYTNPAMGSVASQFSNTLSFLSLESRKSLYADQEGSHPYYDWLGERLYFFQDKTLVFWSLIDQKIERTTLSFTYILTSVAGSWQVPSLLYLGENRHLIWHRIPYEKSQQAQLTLYDSASGQELDTWLLIGEQGTLALVRKII